MNQVYLIIGSNIDPESNIQKALHYLADYPSLKIIKVSSVWRTRPVGSRSDDFYNVSVHITTDVDETELKNQVLSTIERNLGRIRSEDKFAPRKIDLDIVMYNEHILDENLFKYDYLILPFAEILPEMISSVHGISMKQLAAAISPFSTAKKVKIDLSGLF